MAGSTVRSPTPIVQPSDAAPCPLVARFHYDMDSSFFEQMLGPTMAYSCGYWRHAASLDQAQRDKHDLICRKLQIDQHDRVLDIGCGWGAFAKHAAETYGCRVIGITISQSQYDYARVLRRIAGGHLPLRLSGRATAVAGAV